MRRSHVWFQKPERRGRKYKRPKQRGGLEPTEIMEVPKASPWLLIATYASLVLTLGYLLFVPFFYADESINPDWYILFPSIEVFLFIGDFYFAYRWWQIRRFSRPNETEFEDEVETQLHFVEGDCEFEEKVEFEEAQKDIFSLDI